MLSLDKMEFATRSQLQELHGLSSKRNASRVLHNMKEYLHVKRMEENIYWLNSLGRKVIRSNKKEPKFTLQVPHAIMRNDIFIYYNQPDDWEVERHIDVEVTEIQNGIMFKKVKSVRPDARFTINGQWHFLEVDRTAKMKTNEDKIRLYHQILPNFTKSFHRPKIIFYTDIESRKEKLLQLGKGLDMEVLTKRDIY
ncbi:replication-relaxation family protein [Sutcliffiella horikoshii]|uniref:replication-relaxation family protein n=1 Tax=Sutcliffiella horikoshii TaxID=79883 RepID=UPI001653DBB6|nr:replication-relaxation family protein [Sutcliffiella horikoshii]